MTKNDLYTNVLYDGCSVEIGKLSLCCIDNYYQNRHGKKRGYQVHCDHHKFRFTEIYEDIDAAVDKFLLIKNRIYKQ